MFNLHLVQWASGVWTNNLLLRDFLRAHLQEANRYWQ
ncbi:MAG: GrpB family protein [Nostocaceae cyanobacterium]|nr:GrpB family protein [Nostocaceae cyanobacterium]